jgi:hypothetical protein
MSEPLELNKMLQGRTILSVEPGTTPGWMTINLDPSPHEREVHPDIRVFLTVFIGGRKGSSEDNHFSTCAVHYKSVDGGSEVDMVRDSRDPEMPMSSAYDVFRVTKPDPEDAESGAPKVERTER